MLWEKEKMLVTRLKAFADDNLNVAEMAKFVLDTRKHCGKRRKCWLTVFFPVPTMFPNAFFNGRYLSGLCGTEFNSLLHNPDF